MTARQQRADPRATVNSVIAAYDGDARAALTAALDDVAYLRREIELAQLAMSFGFARGWRPSLERPPKPSAE